MRARIIDTEGVTIVSELEIERTWATLCAAVPPRRRELLNAAEIGVLDVATVEAKLERILPAEDGGPLAIYRLVTGLRS